MDNIRNLEVRFKDDICKIFRENKIIYPFVKWELSLSSDLEDSKFSYDMVYNGKVEISVRLRNNYYLKYRDFTIRCKSRNNGITEIDKLKSGMGNVYFYGWLNDISTEIQEYVIVDINKIRGLLDQGTYRTNTDNTAFMAYDISFLKRNDAIIKQSFPEQQTIEYLF